MYMRMYIRIHGRSYGYISVYRRICTRTGSGEWTFCKVVYVRIGLCTYIYVYIHVCMYVYIYVHIGVFLVYRRICTHTGSGEWTFCKVESHPPGRERQLRDGRGPLRLVIPTPYTLHPTPYTLHPTPYTLHPTP